MSIFTKVPVSRVGRSTFDLTHSHKLSCHMGDLVPIYCEEVIPSDHFKQSVQTLVRFQPMVAPMMHEVDVTVHYFFVPNRILWNNFEKFIFAPAADVMPPAPSFAGLTCPIGSLGDYLGYPSITPITKCSALPFAAYQKIYNDYYRDENLIAPVVDTLVDGNNDPFTGLTTMRKRAWGHDYFTSALPFAQRGEAVSIPIAGFSDVPVDGIPGQDPRWMLNNGAGTVGGAVSGNVAAGSVGKVQTSGADSYYEPNGSLVAKTSELDPTAATINDLRAAFRLQEWFEKNARGGVRMVEGLLVHFGVVSDDLRLQRPKYLGGSKQPLVVSEVLQTSSSDTTTPQGNMAGHGISVGGGKQFSYECKEHGWIIGIMSILPKTGYLQGLPRKFSKFDRLDYAWPTFANLGEQPILNKELYCDSGDGKDDDTFGYIPRYSEYKYAPSRVSGDFKGDLAFWHMARIFNTRPALNPNFVTSDPTKRIFAVTDPTEDECLVQVLNIVKATRPLPYYGVPKL